MKGLRQAAMLLALAGALLLGGCAAPKNPGMHGKTQFAPDAPDAIVVMGVKSAVREDGSMLVHKTIKLTWARIVDGKPESDKATSFAVDTMDDLIGIKAGGAAEMTWHVVRLPPGTYMLEEVFAHRANNRFVTRTAFAPGTPYFTVKAGELRHIGELHWNVNAFPARLVKLTRNDAQAREALAEYPGVTAPLQFRPPAVVPPGKTDPVYMTVSQ